MFPTELLSKIFIQLTVHHFINIRFISRFFNIIIESIEYPSEVVLFRLDYCPKNVINVNLDIEDYKYDIKNLRRLNHIQRLDLSTIKIDFKKSNYFEELTRVTSINLSFTGVNDNCLYHLSKLKHLQKLSLCGNYITNKGIKKLSQSTSIEKLNIEHCLYVNDVGCLSQISSLKKLSIGCDNDKYYLGNLTPENFDKLTNIKELKLSYNIVTAKLILQINSLKQLKKLSIVYLQTTFYNQDIKLTINDLEKLSFECGYTNRRVKTLDISECPKLISLSIDCDLIDCVSSSLSNLKKLKLNVFDREYCDKFAKINNPNLKIKLNHCRLFNTNPFIEQLDSYSNSDSESNNEEDYFI